MSAHASLSLSKFFFVCRAMCIFVFVYVFMCARFTCGCVNSITYPYITTRADNCRCCATCVSLFGCVFVCIWSCICACTHILTRHKPVCALRCVCVFSTRRFSMLTRAFVYKCVWFCDCDCVCLLLGFLCYSVRSFSC